MKIAWIIIGSFLALFIIIQFFQPEKNDKIANPQNDIFFSIETPVQVKKKIVNACYDCHSEKTVYPFYNRIAPVSWILANHIKEGKAHLNFSDWASYDRKKQIKLLNEICEVITNGEMPLKGYVLMHSKSIINEKELEEICVWTEQAAEEVMSRKD
ncbi:MAG: cytochrome C [Deltaproteobacteria bacterium]|nr:MAG: cytochrome C [Deltaproteobacteria bacterium]